MEPSFANSASSVSKHAPKSKISKRKIQLVILFDTSNSMDGLLEQAKSRLWEIVNETRDCDTVVKFLFLKLPCMIMETTVSEKI
jgi:hypothetical protein